MIEAISWIVIGIDVLAFAWLALFVVLILRDMYRYRGTDQRRRPW